MDRLNHLSQREAQTLHCDLSDEDWTRLQGRTGEDDPTAALGRRLTGASLVDAATFAARVGAFAATGNGAQPSYPTTESALPEVTDA